MPVFTTSLFSVLFMLVEMDFCAMGLCGKVIEIFEGLIHEGSGQVMPEVFEAHVQQFLLCKLF